MEDKTMELLIIVCINNRFALDREFLFSKKKGREKYIVKY